MSGVDIEVVISDEEFYSLEADWNSLLRDSNANNIFLTWEWISNWWNCFGRDRKLWVLLAKCRDSGQLVGLAPLNLCKSSLIPGFLPFHRELSFLGANEVAPDHLDFVICRGYENVVSRAFMDYIEQHPDWDLVRLDGLRSESSIAPFLMERNGSWGHHCFEKSIPVVHLPGSWEIYQSQLGRKLRRNLRRSANQLEMECPGQVKFNQVNDIDELEHTLLTVVRLAASVRGSRGEDYAFCRDENVEFLRNVCAEFLRKNWLWATSLKVGSEDIAASIIFRYDGSIYGYQTGYNLAWRKFQPGVQILVYELRRAIEAGCLFADFLRGDEGYKNEWTDNTVTDLYLKLGNTLKGRILVQIYALARFFYRWLLKNQDKLPGHSFAAFRTKLLRKS